MNKRCYRIVFNKTRGLLMAVAETAVSQGKAAGTTLGSAFLPEPKGRNATFVTVHPLTFGVWSALGLVMCVAVAHAQIVADPNAPANQRPTILNTANGVPQVNIQTPSAAGVSRNAYTQFDVQRQGAVLNNSRTDVQTQQGGWIQGNPWLAGGTARVILNEVTSSNPSLLQGYVEVAGSRAQVVIANPAGVSCDGCGFINANRATLTTGTPIVNGGSLDGYLVQGGAITISGAGMDASRTDYTDLIARTVQVNTGIWANQLKVIAGANQVDAENTQATRIAGIGLAPSIAIDVAQLGGMYAGKITLVGTEAGVGVRNAGNIGASAGEVVVTVDGRLENAGRITSGSHMKINAEGGIQNSDILYAQGDTRLSTRGDIDNSGIIVAQGDVLLTANGTDSRITSTSSSVLGAGVQTDGSLGVNGALTLDATQTITAHGQNLSSGNQSLTAQTLDLAGSQTSADHLSLDATSGDINASGATLAAQALTAHASQTLRTDQARVLAGQIQINAHELSNIQGEIVQVGTGNLTLTSHGTLDNTQGLIAADQTLASKTLAITNTGGTMIAGQRLEIDSASLTGDGKLFSQGDLNVKLVQDYTHTGELQANGNAHLETSGTLINQSTLLGGTVLQLKAATIDNQANGQISASKLALDATHTLTNRGLIDGEETIIETATLNNRGTGRIYGNHVAISAATVTNDAENSAAPVIAARDRLDIAAETIVNREHALIFSAGDLAIGDSLDTNKQAIGQAGAVNNASATIEALGNLDISARQINNTNEHFSTTVEFFGPEYVVEYQGSGSANRYLPGSPGVYVYDNESDYLMTPEGSYENWLAYSYYRTVTETKVLSSDPGQILSGGAMTLTTDSLLNDKSRVIAGGTLTGNIGTLANTEVPGERTITDSGAVTSYWRNYQKGRDSTGSSTAGYNPPTAIQAISLTPTVYQQNASPGGTGTQVAAVSAISQVDALNAVVRTGGANTALPNNSLFSLSPNPNAGYLIETDPRFASYRNWLSSDYLLNALSIDPATMQKRLGDGFYEQKLIREQVAQLTGRRFLDGYASDEAQYQALLNNAATFAQTHGLRPGVALSAEQMAALTSDIVWLVEQDVILADGQTVRALVPQLYVRVQDGDLHAAGALIAGSDIHLNLAGDLVNSGTIAGRNVVALSADNVKNLGGRIAGNDVGVAARTDLDNLGGVIEAGNSLTAIAGRDLNLRSSTRTQSNAQGSRTQIDRVAALYVTGSGGTLIAAAGRDVNLAGAVLVNAAATDGTPAGSTVIAAGRDLNLATVAEASSNSLAWDGGNRRQDSSRSEVGTTIRTQGDLRLQAGNDLNARAADVSSEQGALLAAAGRDVNLTAAELNRTVDEAHQHTGSSSAFSRTTITTRDTLDETTAQGTTLSGHTATVLAGQDINLIGSNAVSTAGTILSAQNDVNLAAATNTTRESHLRDEKTSGLFSSGGIGFTIGTQQQSTDQQAMHTAASASTIGSTDGNIQIQAGRHYRQVGSDVLAPQGDIDITAQRVDIVEARDTRQNVTETQFKQSGLTVAITSPIISAIQTAQQMGKAASQTKDSRMQALAGANTALAGKNAYDAIQAGQGSTINGKEGQIATGTDADGNPTSRDATAADQVGGINLSISLGTSQSHSTTVQTGSSAAGSTVAAGGDVNIRATGAGQESDLTIQGSRVTAGNNVALLADDEIALLAARNTAEQHSTNKNSSASVGVSVGSDGLLFTAGASGGRGHADGSDASWTNTHVKAGDKLTLESGGDTTLRGAVAGGEQVVAKVGGDLAIESLQDTSQFDSKQQSIGGSVSIGYGKVGGSFSASKSAVDSDYASVTEQSGIAAGDGGFQVDVKGDTALTGGAITSTQAAIDNGLNRFKTEGALTLSDLQNRADYDATSLGVNFGSGISFDGKLAPTGTGAGLGQDSGSAGSTTQAAISGIAGNQGARTGDAETGIAPIFDADKVQKDIDAQVQITQLFGQQASKAVEDYVQAQRKALQEQLKNASETEKAAVQAQLSDLVTQERVMNVLIGAVTGMGASALTKESLSVAAEKMREIMIEDSKKFPGVIDAGGMTLDNISGKSEGVRGDGIKLGGTRVDLDLLCGTGNSRCATNPDGSLDLKDGMVQFIAKDEQGNPVTLADFIKTPDGQKMLGATGGIQGFKGTLFGIPYEAGSWQDKLIEAFGGTHDYIGGSLSGLYDEQGNIKQGMTSTERAVYNRWSEVALVPSASFAAAEFLPPEVWQAVAIFLKAAK